MKALKKIAIMGGVGGGQIAAAIMEDINKICPTWEIMGYLNDSVEIGTNFRKYPVIGRTEEAPNFAEKGYYLVCALHNLRYGRLRINRIEKMGIPLEAFPPIIHPTVITSMAESIGQGVIIGPYVNISVDVTVGNYCFFGGSIFLGHDTKLEDFVAMSNNAATGATIRIGKGTHVSINTSIREFIQIGRYALIGMGAVVIKDVGEGEIAVGNPAKIIGKVDQYYSEEDKRVLNL
ncbi:MAG: hypothetical protein HQ591_01125 [candidate division Zixibacteria bacterium]|nr:hypothetical protein [Candidatus Tariuqbacter arcticus]